MEFEYLELKKIVECDESDWKKYLNHFSKMHKEDYPLLPEPNLEKRKKVLLTKEHGYDSYRWMIFDRSNSDIVGYVFLGFENEDSPGYDQNSHLSSIYITLEQKYRKQGIGTYYLEFLKNEAKLLGKSQISTWTPNEIAKLVLNKSDFVLKHKHYVNMLKMKEIDWGLMENWIDETKSKNPACTIELYNSIPDSIIEEFVQLYEKTNSDAPWEGDGVELFTPETFKKKEQLIRDLGGILSIFVSREPNGEISGLTEIIYNDSEKDHIQQELTGVLKKFRSRGIGKWLKAEMLFYIKDKYPEAEYITTGNAMKNEAMLGLNRKMGFKETNVFHLYSLKI